MKIFKKTILVLNLLILSLLFSFSFFAENAQAQDVSSYGYDFYVQFTAPDDYNFNYPSFDPRIYTNQYSSDGISWMDDIADDFLSELADLISSDFGIIYGNKLTTQTSSYLPLSWSDDCAFVDFNKTFPPFECTSNDRTAGNYHVPTESHVGDLGDGLIVSYKKIGENFTPTSGSSGTANFIWGINYNLVQDNYTWIVSIEIPEPTVDIKAGNSDAVFNAEKTNEVYRVLEGNSFDLNWTGEYTERGYIALDDGQTDIGSVSISSVVNDKDLFPTQDTTYTITAYSTASSTITATDRVSIDLTHKPVGTLSASPTTVNVNDSSNITGTITDEEGGWMYYEIEKIAPNAPNGVGTKKTGSVLTSANTPFNVSDVLTLNQQGTWWVGLHIFDYDDNVWGDSKWVSINSNYNTPSVDIKAEGPSELEPSDDPITIVDGDPVNLTFVGSNVVPGSCSINNVFGPFEGTSGSTSDNPEFTTIYTVTCTGDSTTDGRAVSDSVEVIVQGDASLNVQVQGPRNLTKVEGPITIVEGESATVSWTSSNVRDCSATPTGTGVHNNVGRGSYNSSSIESPNTTTTYQITCQKDTVAGGTISDSVQIVVQEAAFLNMTVQGPRDLVPKTDSTTIINGESATISWELGNVSNCSATPIGSGVYYSIYYGGDVDGWSNQSPSTDTTYQITCNNDTVVGGTISDNVRVLVQEGSIVDIKAKGPDNPAPEDGPISIWEGDTVNLTWDLYNVRNCNGSGSFSMYYSVLYDGVSATDSPTIDTIYGIACEEDNVVGAPIDDTVEVLVTPVPAVTADIDIWDWSINNYVESSADYDYGSTVYFRWNSANASGCTSPDFNTHGAESGYSSIDTSQTDPLTINITCDSTYNSDTASDSVTANFGTAVPSLQLESSDYYIYNGQTPTLTWTSSNVQDCSITDDNGNSADDIGSVASNDSIGVTPDSTLEYFIYCSKTELTGDGGGQMSDSVVVYVTNLTISSDLQVRETGSTLYDDDDSIIIERGDEIDLKWSSDADSCTGVNFNTINSPDGYDGGLTPDNSIRYTLNCIKTSDGVSIESTDFVDVAVTNPEAEIILNANKYSIEEGETAELNYVGRNIISDSCRIDNEVGLVPDRSGTKVVDPRSDTIYTITCDSSLETNKTVFDTVAIDVIEFWCNYSGFSTGDYTNIDQKSLCYPTNTFEADSLRPSTEEYWTWSCYNGHVFDSCQIKCPNRYIADDASKSCVKDPNIEIETWELDPNIVNEGEQCEANWTVYTPDLSNTTCTIIGDGDYSQNLLNTNIEIGTYFLDSGESYKLSCVYTPPSGGEPYDDESSWESCVINPDIDEF